MKYYTMYNESTVNYKSKIKVTAALFLETVFFLEEAAVIILID